LRRQLKDLFAQMPRLSLPRQRPTRPLAVHEFFLLKQFLFHYENLRKFVDGLAWKEFTFLGAGHVFSLLDPEGSGAPSFRIYEAYSPKLAEYSKQRDLIALRLKQARQQLLAEAGAELNLPQLKEEFVISRGQQELADRLLHSGRFVLVSENIANLRFHLADDDESLALKEVLSRLKLKREKEEARVLRNLSLQIFRELAYLRSIHHYLSYQGLNFILAEFALEHGCCLPVLTKKKQILIRQARNLPLELHLKERGRNWQAFDYEFDQRISLITGPNMGGKTTVLKTVGQICWLARLGIPLPCREASLPLFDHIWFNQAEEEESSDLSSFGREVASFAQALRQEGLTLFLLDEFARGTNPAEGEALAVAVLQYLSVTPHVCLAATHYTKPALINDLAQYSVAGLDPRSPALKVSSTLSPAQRLKALAEAMDFRLVRLKKNQAPPLSAMTVARILGLPQEILDLAAKDRH
jgi:DNA mismatch repair ATPase MutS